MADNQPENTEINIENPRVLISELQKKYGIQRDSFYGRLRYLRIVTWKEGGKAYLDAGQVEQMDGLHNHIKATGRMEGYPVPEPSGPQDETAETSSAIALQETQQIEATKPNYDPGQRQHQTPEMEAIAALVRSAQGKAAGLIIAENILAKQYLENPETLPEELQAKIKESAQMPEIDPFAYANALTNFAKGSGLAA